jgi:hypothetical protein
MCSRLTLDVVLSWLGRYQSHYPYLTHVANIRYPESVIVNTYPVHIKIRSDPIIKIHHEAYLHNISVCNLGQHIMTKTLVLCKPCRNSSSMEVYFVLLLILSPLTEMAIVV